jgi:hypothetical protein
LPLGQPIDFFAKQGNRLFVIVEMQCIASLQSEAKKNYYGKNKKGSQK